MNNETLDKMRQLHLYGMYDAFKTNLETSVKESLTADQFIALLVASEWDDRRNRYVERAIRLAGFRYKASLEQIDYAIDRGLEKNQVHRLAALDFVKEHKDVFITGSTGTGKSYLATALGYQACQSGYKVMYVNTAKLMGQLKLAKEKGTILAELKRIERADLLILDDFGLQPFDAQSRASLLDIIEDRHQKRSTVVTSQIPVKEWYDIIGEKTIADAINVSYERFWEGRKLWGEQLNTTRSLTRQALTLVNTKVDHASVGEFVQLLNACTYALKHQLRGSDPHEDLGKRLNEAQLKSVKHEKYKPIVITRLLGEWVQKAKLENKIDTIQQARFDENIDKMTDVVGGCERIVSTPIPYSYRVLLHRTVYIYCFLLPFGLVDSLGWLTPLIVVFIAYTFVAFEAIADEIEEPFGTEANDLALNSMCQTIETTLWELVGKSIELDQKPEHGYID